VRRAFVALALVLSCASCSDGKKSAEPTPTPSPSSTTPQAVATYGASEQAAYIDALADYHAYVERSAAISAAGRTTVADRDYLKQWSSDWRAVSITLTQLQDQGITIVGTPEVISEKPTRIDLAAEPKTIKLKQCLDQTNVKVLKNGVSQAKPVERYLSIVMLTQAAGEDWWRVGVPEQGDTC